MERLSWDGRTLMYGYTIISEFLPGPEGRSRSAGGSRSADPMSLGPLAGVTAVVALLPRS